ncbi:MAG: thioredoxin family protein [Planctomycetaceae bacterium]
MQLWRMLPWIVALSLWPELGQGGNFHSSEARLVTKAELARTNSATFWTGTDLQRNWSRSCPIVVDAWTGPAQGSTRFTFADGEVFNWEMHVAGTPDKILVDVIPHEVDHMVRATLLRRPVVRWLDEGCAAFFESDSAKAQLRLLAQQESWQECDIHWLTAMQYPADAAGQTRVYRLGFGFVEFLLSLRDAACLLQFQASTNLQAACQQFYGFPLHELPARWNAWNSRRRLDGTKDLEEQRGKLRIWTADWCGPCRQFKADIARHASFREWLLNHYEIEFVNYDQNLQLAKASGIRSIPAFEQAQGVIIGYLGPSDLMTRLDAAVPPPPIAVPSLPPVADESKVSPKPLTPVSEEPGQSSSDAAQTPSTPQESNVLSVHEPKQSGGLLSWLPAGLTILQWAGILGGTAASGGVAAIGISLLTRWLGVRLSRRLSNQSGPLSKGGEADVLAPFPRQLDEARELYALRQSEGRVAALDALRGMFLDDELEKLDRSDDAAVKSVVQRIRASIDQRVDEVAPLSTQSP